MIGMWPEGLYKWYTVLFCFLMPLRYWSYHKRGYQYFLSDLCYWTNGMLLIFIWLLPSSTYLFTATYCLANGSLSWAIVAWRNSLVFHSVDKVTSLFIHIYPPFLLYSLVHLLPSDFQETRFPAISSTPFLNAKLAIITSTVAYTIWQTLYYIFIQVRRRDKIAAGRPTSFTYLRRSYSKTWIGKLVLKLPESLQPFAFMFIQVNFVISFIFIFLIFIFLHFVLCCFILSTIF